MKKPFAPSRLQLRLFVGCITLALVTFVIYYLLQPSLAEEYNLTFLNTPVTSSFVKYKVFTGDVSMTGISQDSTIHKAAESCYLDNACREREMVTRYENALEVILELGEMGAYTTSNCQVKIVSGRPRHDLPNRVGSVCEPWISRNAIELLDRLLDHRTVALEWGGGTGTLWTLPRVKSLITVEHNLEWFNNLRKTIDSFPARISQKWKGRMLELGQKYTSVDFIEEGTKFDYINVDARLRVECFKRALQLLRPAGGILMLDNSERQETMELFALVPKHWKKAQFTFPGVSQTTIWISTSA